MTLRTLGTSNLPVPMTLAQFYEALLHHDWYFAFSDDAGVCRAGEHAEKKLELIATQSPEHRALYDGFTRHYFSGPAWKTEQTPLPARPVAP